MRHSTSLPTSLVVLVVCAALSGCGATPGRALIPLGADHVTWTTHVTAPPSWQGSWALRDGMPAGCLPAAVASAIATLDALPQRPETVRAGEWCTTVGKIGFDRADVCTFEMFDRNKVANKAFAALEHDLGDALDTRYGRTGSSSYANRLEPVLLAVFGLTVSTVDLSTSDGLGRIQVELRAGRPVVATVQMANYKANLNHAVVVVGLGRTDDGSMTIMIDDGTIGRKAWRIGSGPTTTGDRILTAYTIHGPELEAGVRARCRGHEAGGAVRADGEFLLLDRGFPSRRPLHELVARGIHFVMRMTASGENDFAEATAFLADRATDVEADFF